MHNSRKSSSAVQMNDSRNQQELTFYTSCLEKINQTDFSSLSDQSLQAIAVELRNKANQGIHPDLLLPISFALVREASWRILGLRPYDVQILAGIALSPGKNC